MVIKIKIYILVILGENSKKITLFQWGNLKTAITSDVYKIES